MPTGYTAAVQDGSITELKDFAYSCARAMGACISMRDDPSGKPIPERFEPSTYYKDRLEQAQSDLAVLQLMTVEECAEEAQKEFEQSQEYERKRLKEKTEYRARYETMLRKVSDWRNSPEGLKKFMMDQLHESIKWDCPDDEDWYTAGLKEPPKLLTGEEWFDKRQQSLLRDVARSSEEYAKELERVEGRNKWVHQLRVSLGDA